MACDEHQQRVADGTCFARAEHRSPYTRMHRLDFEPHTIGRCLGAFHTCAWNLVVDVREHPDPVYWIVDAAESYVGRSDASNADLLQGHDAFYSGFADKSHRDQ